ncbi:1-acyl-sn-glycerol-3-phosphate acyltransferase [Desulforhabdus amnigena]|jgi:glycerol-3-phosphate O-acyltransferase|uniref:Glycerol-3-phosphate acyltransferase n=1 Tax=Desulforhabdus amnigena TaxID=40218 RepID=A0A9W6FVW6_9BACT|nr:1-acyl-sn-glycerol-3-phosphate acyltransferase [Desulforhabdus amnigena]NLJ26480.1 hypothetical protein [Deltaproteobacteria bacterium]GLI35871.1 hypothetical protein DAMNIGENAA_33040 [Desulforhabdus amnigena]
MSQWWQKFRKNLNLSVDEDRYGYSVQRKPRFLMQGWFERLISRISMPEDQQRLLEELAKRGTVVYAIKYRSQFDYVYAALRLYQLGLPPASFVFDQHPYLWQPRWYAAKILVYHFWHLIRHGCLPDPYDDGYYREKIQAGQSGLFFLLGKKGYYKRTVLVGNDPIEHLFEIQKERERPIFVVPLMLLYTRHPSRERRGFLDLFQGQKDCPGPLRKLISFLQGYSNAVLEAGEALNLQEILPELSEEISERRKQIFQVRRGLIDSVDEIRRAIVGPTMKSNLELKEIILHHPRLEAFMQRRARSSSLEIWKVRMEADGYLDEIAASYSYPLVELGAKILTWVWNNLFDGIDLDMDSLQRVKRAARHNTIVYIPCHKSHIDYLILSYLLFKNNLFAPFVAAGKNLAFWPLGPIFRRCGAFFIRRSFKGLRFYAEVFSLYVKTMVQLGHNIEFFIEGGRSRTGKMVLPKMGLLAILIQAVEEGFCDDLVFVPTSICYDRIPEEESYLKEISGGAKVQENIGQLVRARRFLKKRYGRVYVQFAEPLSLQNHLERYRTGSHVMRPKERHAMYRDFAYRIINSINKASMVTPHALTASALLTSSRHGVSLAEVQEISRAFYDYLSICGVRFSKTFKSYDKCMEETLWDLERSKLVGKLKDEDDDLEEEVFTMEDSKRLTLEYYKNNIIHFLLPAAFVSTSILAQDSFRFSLAEVLEDVDFMNNFFKFEFVYDNEVSTEKLVSEVLSTFEAMGWVQRVGEDDKPYILTHKGLRFAHCFHGLLRNYFEGYWLVLRAFRYLQKNPYSEKDFMKKVLSLGQKALKLELVERPESVSKIIFNNALKFYVEKGIVEKKIEEEKGKDKEAECYADTGNRLLVQHYSKQISRFLRSPHFALQ